MIYCHAKSRLTVESYYPSPLDGYLSTIPQREKVWKIMDSNTKYLFVIKWFNEYTNFAILTGNFKTPREKEEVS